MKIPSGLHLLIDGDIFRYRLGFAAERTVYLVARLDEGYRLWDEASSKKEALEILESYKSDVHAKAAIYERKDLQPVEYALKMVDNQIDGIFSVLKPSGYTVYLSGNGNFRTKIAETREYKASRAPRPTHYRAIGDYLGTKYSAKTVDGREADDALGVDLSADPTGRCIVSIDKDLNQISGWHHNFVTGESYWVTKRDGDFYFYTQMLTGDTTDNIPGIDGIGPAKAFAILDGSKSTTELCRRTWNVYRSKFDDPERALRYFREQAGLLWIQRTEHIEYRPPAGCDLPDLPVVSADVVKEYNDTE